LLDKEEDELRQKVAPLLTIAFLLMLPLLCVAQSGKVDSIGPLTDSAVPEAVRQSLDAKGYRLVLDDPKPACELWIRKSVPAGSKKDTAGVVYPQLAESTLVGVIHFPQTAADFRGHPVPAGFYTLRYELMPDDGNHLGAAPNRDFVVLIPAQSDPDPSASFKSQDLITMSAKTSGTKHPSPLSLPPAEGAAAGTVAKDDQDHWVFSTTVKLASGEELPFAVVVKGTAQQ
jgi:hypothetical protein